MPSAAQPFDRIGDAYFIVDSDGALLDANQAAVRLIGCVLRIGAGQTASLLPFAADAVGFLADNSDTCELQLVVCGQPRWYEVSLSPLAPAAYLQAAWLS